VKGNVVASGNVLRNAVSFDDKDVEYKIQSYNKMNGIMRQSFGKQMSR
jgi:hypothetical protein